MQDTPPKKIQELEFKEFAEYEKYLLSNGIPSPINPSIDTYCNGKYDFVRMRESLNTETNETKFTTFRQY